MYIFVFYDIAEKRVNKVFKICKKYLTHYQYSVFRGDISEANLVCLDTALNRVINLERDFISIVKFQGQHSFNEAVIGTMKRNTEGLFI
jgi:CRISPR-associated protein Cas2